MRIYTTSVRVFIQLVYVFYTTSVRVFIQLVYACLYN